MNQGGEIGRSYSSEHLKQPLHRGTVPDHLTLCSLVESTPQVLIVYLQLIHREGVMQDPLGFSVLRRSLLAVEYRERAAAAHGLASLAEYLEPEQRNACLEPVIDFLIEAGATDPWLRHAGVRALGALTTPEQQRSLLLHEDPNIRRLGVVVLRRKRDGFIVEALADSDPAVGEEAVRAIH